MSRSAVHRLATTVNFFSKISNILVPQSTNSYAPEKSYRIACKPPYRSCENYSLINTKLTPKWRALYIWINVFVSSILLK